VKKLLGLTACLGALWCIWDLVRVGQVETATRLSQRHLTAEFSRHSNCREGDTLEVFFPQVPLRLRRVLGKSTRVAIHMPLGVRVPVNYGWVECRRHGIRFKIEATTGEAISK